MCQVFIFVNEEVAHVEILLETQDSDVEVLLDIQILMLRLRLLCLKLFPNFGFH